MQYVSTRGEAPASGFADILLAGLASDGGLYVPAAYPRLDPSIIAGFAGQSYADVAYQVIAPFVGDDIAEADLRAMINDAYATFRHPAVTPLVQMGPNDWLLELFHGPTLAFKDVAMQLLARMMDHVLRRRGRRATIIGATSGDTGGAAIEAFRGLDQVDVVILYPHGRVSDVQRRQMTTVADDNIHALAVEGTFDDCQTIVKQLFADRALREQVGLSGVNSINWARIAAQIVYYFVAASALGAPGRAISFCVPTGNFGDIFAGYVAKRMGLDIDRLVIATNANDILARTLESGRYALADVVPTTSPSMDIQISSNFERLMFEAQARDATAIRTAMAGLGQSGSFALTSKAHAAIAADFAAHRALEDEVGAMIGGTYGEAGYLLDPHTAVARVAARATQETAPMVTLATAHPAKFPDAVEAASGVHPALPSWLADLHQRSERFEIVPADRAAIAAYLRHCHGGNAHGVDSHGGAD